MGKTTGRGNRRRPVLTYRDAGVDISANDEMVERIRHSLKRTHDPRVLSRHNAFAGLMRLDVAGPLLRRRWRDPVLVAGADGVGSKLLVALAHGRIGGLGIDLVAMNVNDVLTCGAEPLFFLDYVACHRLDPARVTEIVEGIAEGCAQAGCALLGGETAEMPDLYKPAHFDLAGFCVGVVERGRIIDGSTVEPGDVVLGLASSGIHSNGFALVRRALGRLGRSRTIERSLGEPLVDAVLRPTRIYARPVLALLRRYPRRQVIGAMAHITGGGLAGNLPRVIPPGREVHLRRGGWPVPPIFRVLASAGIEEEEMFRVFNMGIGFVLVVRRAFAAAAARFLAGQGEQVYRVGTIRRGDRGLVWR